MTRDERFFGKTAPGEDGCLLWTGANDGTYGYGVVRRGNTLYKAHRWAWMMENGPIPEGMMVCHTCDTPACVNISHLFLGTSRDNAVDMIEKGRGKSGRPRRGSKLSIDDVLAIRDRWSGGETQKALAEAYGVDQTHISRLVRMNRGVWAACPTCHRPF